MQCVWTAVLLEECVANTFDDSSADWWKATVHLSYLRSKVCDHVKSLPFLSRPSSTPILLNISHVLFGTRYDTPSGLCTHKKLAHSGTKRPDSVICHICAKSYATQTGLQEHMATIHQPREKSQIRCNECGKWLMNTRCYKTHMLLHSDIELQCDQCNYKTKKKELLNRHRITKHSTEKPFECHLCGRAFKVKRALTIHIAQHNSTSIFKCTFCDREFNSSTNYYSHRKHSHPDELAQLKQREEEERRQRRINAGIEQC